MANEEVTREAIAAATKAVMAIPCNNPSVMSLQQGTVGTTLCRELVEKIVNTVLTATSQSRPTKGAALSTSQQEVLLWECRDYISFVYSNSVGANADGAKELVARIDTFLSSAPIKEAAPSLQKRPVAFRARDALDQWILFDNEDEAASYATDTGFEYQGLYARDDKSPAPTGPGMVAVGERGTTMNAPDQIVADIKQQTFDVFKTSRRVWIIEERGAEFIVHRWSGPNWQHGDGVAPPHEYPTLRKAAARLLQLLRIGAVAPQTWPESICIGEITMADDDAPPAQGGGK